MRSVTIAVLAMSVATFGAGCGGNGPGLDRVPEGSWGGDHVSLVVAASAATLDFDCAHGRIDGVLPLDSAGRFGVPGIFVKEHGGPVHEGEPEDAHPAFYEGSTDGRMLSLTVTLTDQGQTVGPFTAVLGATPRVFKCL